jgi:hypothetical protein
MECGLRHLGGDGVRIHRYSSSYLARSEVDRNITSGCCFRLGSVVITWFSRKYNFLALNLVYVEYMVVLMDSCESIWIH